MEGPTPALSTLRFSNHAQWQDAPRDLLDARWAFGELMPRTLGDGAWIGHCPLCRADTTFALPSTEAGHSPDLREGLQCARCGINARCRAGLVLALEAVAGREARVYATEAASRNFVWLQSRFADVHGSEFEPDDEKRQRHTQYLRDLGGRGDVHFEDVTRLTLRDASRDLVVSFDVLEHVPDYRQALREFARVLVPGGALVLTAPFVFELEHTLVRARLREDGEVEHLLEPEYHGDPIGEGVLCFYHFGWDLLDDTRAAGFSTAEIVLPWAPGYGIFSPSFTLVARR
jgi:SAM-dependent methyltransferase